MNPLLKFVVKRIGGKIDDLSSFSDDMDNPAAFEKVAEDLQDYYNELRQLIEEVIL